MHTVLEKLDEQSLTYSKIVKVCNASVLDLFLLKSSAKFLKTRSKVKYQVKFI